MPKNLTIFLGMSLLFCWTNQNLEAQSRHPFYLGIRVGTGLSGVSFRPNLPSEYTNHFHWAYPPDGGFEFDYLVSDSWRLETQLFIRDRKFSFDYHSRKEDGQPLNGTTSVTYALCQIPILVKIVWGDTSTLRPYAFAGPAIGFTTNFKTNIIGDQSPILNNNNNFNPIAFSLLGGIGVSRLFYGRVEEFLELSYNYGLTDLQGPSSSSFMLNPKDFRIEIGGLFVLGVFKFP